MGGGAATADLCDITVLAAVLTHGREVQELLLRSLPVSAKPRVALALAPVTQSEVVALVTALETLGATDRFDLVVPALDLKETTARVHALLKDPHAVRVEPIHEYLRLGHDRVVLASDDPGARGRSMAAMLAATEQLSSGRDPMPMAPAALIAWLARSWSPRVPEVLQESDVVESANADQPLVPGYTDPAACRFVQRWVAAGDVAVEIAPRTGTLSVHMARAAGPRGRVIAIADASDRERLRTCFVLNGVSPWTEIMTTHDSADIQKAMSTLDGVDVLCLDGNDSDSSALEAVSSAILEGRVHKLLARIAPRSVRREPDAVRDVFTRMRERASASFGSVSWDGRVTPARLDELLAVDDFSLVAADMGRSA
jgi:hypothetical protein